jgi:hypothetical protein
MATSSLTVTTTNGAGSNQYRAKGIPRRGLRRAPAAQLLDQAVTDKSGQRAEPTDTEVLARALGLLGSSPDLATRRVVAAHPLCPLVTLQQLAQDENESVCAAAASNPNCPPELLRQLTSKKWGQVHGHAVVASNPNSPPDVFSRIMQEYGDLGKHGLTAVGILANMAGNPSCPPELLAQMLPDDGWSIYKAALTNPACPAPLVRQYAEGIDPAGRMLAANNPSCPPDSLEQLASDKEPMVRRATASNLHTPVGILVRLLDDSDPETASNAVRNPGLSRATLAMWQLVHKQPGTPGTA